MRALPTRTPGGFTLIELMAGVTTSMIIFGGIAEALLRADDVRRTTAARAEVGADAALVLDWLRRDALGADTSRAAGRIGSAAGSFSSPTPPIVEIDALRDNPNATPLLSTGFVLIADIPRPDTNFDGFSMLADVDPGSKVVPMNEFNGTRIFANSDPNFGGFDGNAGSCTAVGVDGCPWALRKYNYTATGGAALAYATTAQVVYSSGAWENTTLGGLTVAGATTPVSINDTHTLDYTTPTPSGRLVQLDRIAYRHNATDKTIERRQCWGPLEPELANEFDFGATSGNGSPLNCTIGTNDTGWLVLARNVVLASFTYLQINGTATTTPALVRGIRLNMTIQKETSIGKFKRYHKYTVSNLVLFRITSF